MLVFLCIGVHDGAVCLAVSSLRHTCTGSHRSRGLSVAVIWIHLGKNVVRPLLFFKWLFFSGSAFLFFCFPPTTPPPFFFSFHCYHSVTGARMSLCVGAHGWVAGIASHGSVLLSSDWLITVEAPGHPGHPPSTQLDAVVNTILTEFEITALCIFHKTSLPLAQNDFLIVPLSCFNHPPHTPMVILHCLMLYAGYCFFYSHRKSLYFSVFTSHFFS